MSQRADGFPFRRIDYHEQVDRDPGDGGVIGLSDPGGGAFAAFTVNAATGALTPIPGSPYPVGAYFDIVGVALDPTGKFFYAANPFGSSSILGFTINAGADAL